MHNMAPNFCVVSIRQAQPCQTRPGEKIAKPSLSGLRIKMVAALEYGITILKTKMVGMTGELVIPLGMP
jgi:hypothetical protein